MDIEILKVHIHVFYRGNILSRNIRLWKTQSQHALKDRKQGNIRYHHHQKTHNTQNKRKTNTVTQEKEKTKTTFTVRKGGDIRCYIGSVVWVPRQAFLLLFPTTASQAFARYCIFAIHYTIIVILVIGIVFIIIVIYRDKKKCIKFSRERCESVYYGS